MIFKDEVFDEVRKSLQGATACILTKKISELWNALDEAGKNKYTELGRQDRVRYETQLAEWKTKNGVTGSSKKSKKSTPSTPGEPAKKGFVSSFIIFCMEMKDKMKLVNPSIKPVEVSQQAGIQWKALTDAEKDVYKQKSIQYNAQRGFTGSSKLEQKRVAVAPIPATTYEQVQTSPFGHIL